MKVAYLPNQNNIVVDCIDESQDITLNGATLLEGEVEVLPTPPQEIINFIKANSYQRFSLHKVENGEVVCRTVEDLEANPYAEWTRDYQIVVPEPEQPVVEEEPPEEEPPEEEPPAE